MRCQMTQQSRFQIFKYFYYNIYVSAKSYQPSCFVIMKSYFSGQISTFLFPSCVHKFLWFHVPEFHIVMATTPNPFAIRGNVSKIFITRALHQAAPTTSLSDRKYNARGGYRIYKCGFPGIWNEIHHIHLVCSTSSYSLYINPYYYNRPSVCFFKYNKLWSSTDVTILLNFARYLKFAMDVRNSIVV